MVEKLVVHSFYALKDLHCVVLDFGLQITATNQLTLSINNPWCPSHPSKEINKGYKAEIDQIQDSSHNAQHFYDNPKEERYHMHYFLDSITSEIMHTVVDLLNRTKELILVKSVLDENRLKGNDIELMVPKWEIKGLAHF